MECDTYQEQMSLWMDDQLAQQEVQQLEAHAAACSSCRTALDALRRMDRLLTSAPMMSPPPGFTNRFQAKMVTRQRRSRTWAGIITLMLATLLLSLSAIALLGISGLALWEGLSFSMSPSQSVSLLLELGRVAVVAGKLVWLILGALAQGLRHPAFIAYTLATAALIAIWTQIVTRHVLAQRQVVIG
jgi:anti-sigma factor RsiW